MNASNHFILALLANLLRKINTFLIKAAQTEHGYGIQQK